MSHVSFKNSQRAETFSNQADQIDDLQNKLNSELGQARADGDYDRVREIKAELIQLDGMEEKVENAMKVGRMADIAVHGDEAFFNTVRPLDNVADHVGELLIEFTGEELEDVKSKSSSSSDVSGDVIKDGAYWLELSRNDPEEFRAQIDNLDDFDKQQAYSDMQNEIQSENRFWSMMTSIQQASHDTAKQIIGNFRV